MRLGYRHPDVMLSELTSYQVAEWLAFAATEPDLMVRHIETRKEKVKKMRAAFERGVEQHNKRVNG